MQRSISIMRCMAPERRCCAGRQMAKRIGSRFWTTIINPMSRAEFRCRLSTAPLQIITGRTVRDRYVIIHSGAGTTENISIIMKRIAVMTSGGDAPGMNQAIRAVVRSAIAYGMEVYGIRQAYSGLLSGDFERLTNREVSGILQRGGTILQTARNEEFKSLSGQRKGIRRLNEHNIEGLVVIGGDGSLRGAMALHNLGCKVVGVPGSIDNDIVGTDMSIGVDSALNTILEALDRLRDTAS